MISLLGCAGWSEPVLFANPGRQVFTRRGTYIIYELYYNKVITYMLDSQPESIPQTEQNHKLNQYNKSAQFAGLAQNRTHKPGQSHKLY